MATSSLRKRGVGAKAEAEALRDKVGALPSGALRDALLRAVDPAARSRAAGGGSTTARHRRGSIPKLPEDIEGKGEDVDEFGVSSKFDLAGVQLGNKSAELLGELLHSPAVRRVKALDLSSCKLTDLGESFTGIGSIATALSKNTVLTALGLARNQIQTQGAAALGRMLGRNKSIRYLDLSRNMLRSEGASVIARAIANDTNPEVRAVQFVLCAGDADCVRMLQSALTSLNLSQNNLTNFEAEAEGGMALAAAIRTHQRLTFLDLSHNRLDSAAIGAIAFAVMGHPVLRDVRLNDNVADAESAEILASSLLENSVLTNLDLHNNRILSDGAKSLAMAVAANSTLMSLDLRGNHISEEGRTAMGIVLRPEAPSVQTAFERLDDVKIPPETHENFTTRARALAVRVERAGKSTGEAKGADPEPSEGKGAEDEEGTADEAPVEFDLTGVDLEDVDLEAKELTLTSVVTGQTVYL